MQSRDSAYRTKWWQDLPLIGLGILFVAALVAMIVVSSLRDLSQLEALLFQVVTLGTGLAGSYRFGRNAAKDAADDMIRPHARAATRRMLSLRDSLYGLSRRIEGYKIDQYSDNRMDVIQAIIDEQIPTGRSAVEDWRDIVPADVDEILQNWQTGWGVDQHDNSN